MIKLSYHRDENLCTLEPDEYPSIESKPKYMDELGTLLTPKPEQVEHLDDYGGMLPSTSNQAIPNMSEYSKNSINQHGDGSVSPVNAKPSPSDTPTNETLQTALQTTSNSKLKRKAKSEGRKVRSEKPRKVRRKRATSKTTSEGNVVQAEQIKNIDGETYALMNTYLQYNICDKYLETEAKLKV